MAAGSTISIRIEYDIAALERTLAAYPNAMRTGISRALNRTASSVRTVAKKEISKLTDLPSNFVLHHLRVHRATRWRLFADVAASAKGVLLSEMPGAKQTKQGISYTGAGGKRILREHAFMHGAKSYIRATAESAGKEAQGRFGLVGRLPVYYAWAPNLVWHFQRRSVWAAMEARAAEQWEKNIAHEIDHALLFGSEARGAAWPAGGLHIGRV